jgi:hypothetical protein
MSTHPYGRHGPHAWRKWHARRFEQPLSPRMAVVFLRLPSTVERLVLVLMQDDRNDDLDLQPPPNGGMQAVTVRTSHMAGMPGDFTDDQQAEKFDLIRRRVSNLASVQGKNKGISDRERHDVLSQDELEDEAMKLSGEYVAAPENSELLAYDATELMELFERSYREGYLLGAKLKSLEELPSQWERKIQRQAHRDRELDERKGDVLADDPLMAQAIRCGLDDLGIHTEDRKRQMVKCVSIYLEAYRNYTPSVRYEQERSSFRPSFSH